MINITYFSPKTNSKQANGNNPDRPVTYRGIVYPWHLDHMNHMNVQHYVGMFDQASWVFLSMLGMDSRYFRDHRRGMAALEQTIQYKNELRLGDMFEIRSAVLEVRQKTIRAIHEMHNLSTGLPAASMTILGVHMDTDARKSSPLPTEVSDRVEFLAAVQNVSRNGNSGMQTCERQ